MSKTLFNTNTFQSKNVRNSDDVGTLKVDTFKATNAILTNITNAELQAATLGVANNALAISTNTTNISGKQDALSTGEGIDITGTTISFDGTLTQDVTTTGTITGTTMNYVDGGVVTNIQTEIGSKQDILTDGNGIDITGTTISFDGTSVTGDITTTGTITGATMNYVDGGVVTNIQTEIENKQDILTQADNAGTNITISGTGVISSAVYSAETNGGLAVNVSNEFSLDLTNLNSRLESPVRLKIDNDTTPQLLIEPTSLTGEDSEIELRGHRNGTTSLYQARILFSNYDNDLVGTNNLGMISGKVLDHTLNLGGMGFYYYPITQTQTQGAFLSAAGNWTFGTSIQNNYKVQIEGGANITGDLEVVGNPNKRIAIANLRKNDATNGLWGDDNYFDFGANMYRIGTSFCSESFGVITLNTDGTYKITVSVQIENQTFNNRVVVGTYVSINGGTGNWRSENNSGRFGLTYIRHDDYGFGGSQYYSDYYELNNGDTIQINTKLGEGSDLRAYDDSEDDNNIHLYGRLEVELISTTDLVENGV